MARRWKCHPYVGIDRLRAVQAPMHTHDTSGQVWLEGRETDAVTLGQFFTVWGVRFDDRCLGSACRDLEVTVDGKVSAAPTEVRSGREPHHRYHGIVIGTCRRPRADKSAPVRPGLAQFRDVTHTHVAGSIHADSTARAPSWLSLPSDVNTLLPSLWSTGVDKDETGVLTVAGLSVIEIAEQVGTPVYVVDEADLRARARAFADAFEGWDVYYAGQVVPLYDGGPLGNRGGSRRRCLHRRRAGCGAARGHRSAAGGAARQQQECRRSCGRR